MSTIESRRREWMHALAMADGDRLGEAWASLPHQPEYRVIRGPETGLVMVRGRAGNTGRRFNLGEMTATRCSVSLSGGVLGHAWIAGVRPDHARLAAVFDAMLQDPDRSDELFSALIQPLLQERKFRVARRAEAVRPSKVDFFTLVRGDD
jgi:alpha-D-ribose 1-methylphosphonate 5-triphosphate synthase subunit PhnG